MPRPLLRRSGLEDSPLRFPGALLSEGPEPQCDVAVRTLTTPLGGGAGGNFYDVVLA